MSKKERKYCANEKIRIDCCDLYKSYYYITDVSFHHIHQCSFIAYIINVSLISSSMFTLQYNSVFFFSTFPVVVTSIPCFISAFASFICNYILHPLSLILSVNYIPTDVPKMCIFVFLSACGLPILEYYLLHVTILYICVINIPVCVNYFLL
uniref:Uncharacterized protein n=1 Tax=Cacopsylla melanoneura TaxID=428564 RepID=A0A8D8VSN8_9HEMI